jgi:hypothetical protein
VGKTVSLETLHAPAFVVHTNEQVGSQFFDTATQRSELLAVLPIASKQDETAHQGVR